MSAVSFYERIEAEMSIIERQLSMPQASLSSSAPSAPSSSAAPAQPRSSIREEIDQVTVKMEALAKRGSENLEGMQKILANLPKAKQDIAERFAQHEAILDQRERAIRVELEQLGPLFEKERARLSATREAVLKQLTAAKMDLLLAQTQLEKTKDDQWSKAIALKFKPTEERLQKELEDLRVKLHSLECNVIVREAELRTALTEVQTQIHKFHMELDEYEALRAECTSRIDRANKEFDLEMQGLKAQKSALLARLYPRKDLHDSKKPSPPKSATPSGAPDDFYKRFFAIASDTNLMTRRYLFQILMKETASPRSLAGLTQLYKEIATSPDGKDLSGGNPEFYFLQHMKQHADQVRAFIQKRGVV